MEHELKTWSSFFEGVMDGTKLFEFREKDRDFKTGDTLLLREYRHPNFRDPRSTDPSGYTGRELRVKVGYILNIIAEPITKIDTVPCVIMEIKVLGYYDKSGNTITNKSNKNENTDF